MQSSRLFEILYILLSKGTVTARELAGRFEVSTRTIYRDVETLSLSGVPIYTSKGKSGGIQLMDGYVLDKSLLTQRERGDILAALQTLKAAKTPGVDETIHKLTALLTGNRPQDVHDWVDADLADWGRHSDQTFQDIKTAIIERRVIFFDYYGRDNVRMSREVEPIQLWFKHRSWYLKSFCRVRNDYRLFKLGRMRSVRLSDEYFKRRTVEEFDSNQGDDSNDAPPINVRLLFDDNTAYRVYDEFGERAITKLPDGKFEVSVRFMIDDWVFGYLLSFGASVKVLEPDWLREEIANIHGQASIKNKS